MAREVVIDFKMHRFQKEVDQALKRFTVLVCHRGWGKTIYGVPWAIRRVLQANSINPRVAYMAPLRIQAKELAWDYVKYYAGGIPRVKANESELRVDIPKFRRINLYGADNADALRGRHLDGAVLDEFGQFKPGVFAEIIRPAISIKKGHVLFMGTPKGRNGFYDMAEYARSRMEDGDNDWNLFVYKASETGLIAREELEEARRIMGEDYYQQEYECSFIAAIVGAYYSDLLSKLDAEKKIGVVPFDPRYKVITGWDLGIGSHLCGWFLQNIPGQGLAVIDFWRGQGSDAIPEATRAIQSKPYVYERHFLPWDVTHADQGTGKTRIETLRSLGWKNIVDVKKMEVADGINAVRLLLPRLRFDREKCQPGIEALNNYRRELVKKDSEYKSSPVHDWASHPADAFRALAIGLRDERQLGNLQLQAIADYDPYDPFRLSRQTKLDKCESEYDELDPSYRPY